MDNKNSSFRLPKGWVWTKVVNLVGKSGEIKDGDWILSRDLSTGRDVRLIQLGDIGVGCFLNKSNKFISKKRANELNCTLLRPGDILISRMAHPIARACIAPNLGYDNITAVDITILRLDFEICNNRFIRWLFNSDFVRRQAEKLSSGTTRKRISRKKLEKLDIPLPPLPEQHRIVAKIEEIFSNLDAGVKSLKKIKEQLKYYRQAVLKYAFEGKLTAEWRLPACRQEKNGVEIVVENFSGKPIPKYKKHFIYVLECGDKTLYKGYATDLRRRIKDHIEGIGSEWTKTHYPVALIHFDELADEKEAIEKERYFKSGIGREWLKELQKQKELEYDIKVVLEKIKKERKNQLGKKYKELPPVDTTDLPTLPGNWIWTKVGKISKRIHYGYTASAINKPKGPKMLRITDIQNNTVNWENVPYCEIQEDEKYKYLLKKGDLVFARTGATVGKSFLIKEKIPEAVFASYLIRIILSDFVKREYVYNFFQSHEYWFQILKGQIGIGQPNVNSQKLSNIVLPLAPFAEQQQIVSEIERRFSEADEVEKVVEQSLKQAERLRQSILKIAFEGKLVPQDPNDEPAKKLLERIKAEKERMRFRQKTDIKLKTTKAKRR